MNKNEKMELLKKELALLEQTDEPEVPPDNESDDETTPQKKTRKPMVKYERSDKQKATIKKALEVKAMNALKRKNERDAVQEELRKETEKKLIEKAIKIKKKHIKKERILEELSDDETESLFKKSEQKATPKPIAKPIAPKKMYTFFN